VKEAQVPVRKAKRESLVSVVVKTAAAGLQVKFEWNYFEELQKNERVLDRYENMPPFEFIDKDVPAWYKEPIPELPAEKYKTFEEFRAAKLEK
jgi:hypothetical protein